MPNRPATFPALAVPCPTCQSPAGALCTSHSGTRTRRHNVHQTRTAAHAAAAADCVTWLVTPQTIAAVDDAVDQYGVYAKGYFEFVDGRTTVVGLRVGSGPDRVVARFGDTLVRHPDGRWSVRPTTTP